MSFTTEGMRGLTERCQHVVQIFLVDEAVTILVDHVERLFELLDLSLIEHGEDIRSGSLSALLGGAPAACCFA